MRKSKYADKVYQALLEARAKIPTLKELAKISGSPSTSRMSGVIIDLEREGLLTRVLAGGMNSEIHIDGKVLTSKTNPNLRKSLSGASQVRHRMPNPKDMIMATQPLFKTPSRLRDQLVYEKVRTCQYIYGEPRYRDFCNKPVKGDQSWCDEHWALCRHKPEDSKPFHGWMKGFS